MKLKDNIKVAFGSINDNKLRTVLTALIIAIGIMALVGILTSIDGMKKSINENFASMGANSYSIRNRGSGSIHIGGGRAKQKRFDNITFEQAADFKEKFTFPATVSISSFASFASTVKYNSTKTNPNILIIASDANYLFTAGYKLADGRNFSTTEQEFGTGVAIIGSEVKKTLFKNGVAEGNIISIGSDKFRVIGVLAEKGSSMGFGGDKVCIIPLLKGKQINTNPSTSYTITAMVNDGNLLSAAVSEGTGIFRNIRKLNTSEENNFQITQSDSLASSLIDNLKFITIAATIIGIITLLGASIGLMNIMLVSVTERTKEIGLRKAMGATPGVIRRQFLIEAIVICQLGGIGGIILGIVIGNLMSMVIGGGFIVPWLWMFSGVALCMLVGLFAGFYPAMKASKLDPVEALRHE
jgi:putative ABC transport system permease protein